MAKTHDKEFYNLGDFFVQTLPWDYALEIADDGSRRSHERTHHVCFEPDCQPRSVASHTGRASRAGRRQIEFFIEQLEARTVLTQLGSVPMGLVDVISNNHNRSNPVSETVFKEDLKTISDPSISGVAFQIDWKAIETFTPATKNKPAVTHMDWSRLDELFRAADKAGKWVQLLISPGFWSPPGVLSTRNNVVTDDFHVQYGQHDNEFVALPMPWDPVYLGDWAAFLKQVSRRYENNREFRVIAAAGPTSVSDEFTEPDHDNTEDVPQQWITTISHRPSITLRGKQFFWTTPRTFPSSMSRFPLGRACRRLTLTAALFRGRLTSKPKKFPTMLQQREPRFSTRVPRPWPKVSLCIKAALSTGKPHKNAAVQSAIGLLISENGYVVTGFQLGSSAENASAKQGAAGDPAVAMVLSIDTGMQQNTNGQHVDYIEVHSEDVEAAQDGTDPAMRAVLGWAASLFPQESALNVVMTSLTEGQTKTQVPLSR